MKKFLFIFIVLSAFVFASDNNYQIEESKHFTYVTPHKIDKNIKELFENHYKKCKKLFKYKIDNITIKIYPSIEEFHRSFNATNATNYNVSKQDIDNNTIHTVSYLNPGKFHRKDSIIFLLLKSIGKIFIKNKTNKNCPEWLSFGLEIFSFKDNYLYKHQYDGYYIHLRKSDTFYSIEDLLKLPTFVDYEKEYQNSDDQKEVRQKYFVIDAYKVVFADFIISKWGMKKLIKLAKNIDNIEKVLNISKLEFNIIFKNYIDSQKLLNKID